MARLSTRVPYRDAIRLVVLAGIVILVAVIHVGIGSSVKISPVQVFHALLAGPSPDGADSTRFIIWSLRLPRALGALLAGALLGASGSVFQALFRNPLADPYIIGTSSGAAVGGVVSLLVGLDFAWWGLSTPIFAFAGGLASLAMVLALSRRRTGSAPTTLLLAGVLVGSLLSAVLSLCLYLAGRDSNQVLRWLLGSVDPMYWTRVAMMAAMLALAGVPLVLAGRNLNALALGESTAARLGVNTVKLKRMILLCGAAMTATAVGSTGIIGFVGLVAPHTARRVLGVDWRISLIGSMLFGSLVLLVADFIAQSIIADGLPVGIVTALFGAPLLLVLLKRQG